MKFDDVLHEIGDFGWYQGCIIFLLYLPGLFLAMQNFAYTFISAIPDHRCFVDGCDNRTTSYYEPFLNFTTPTDSSKKYSECQLYTQYDSNETCPNYQVDRSKTFNCDYWKYDDSVYKSTVVSEWNLVCDDSNLVALSQSVYMLGNMIGGICFGLVSDKYGRKKILMLCLFICLATGVSSAYVPYYSLFVTLKFFLGASTQGAYIVILVMSVEMVGRRQRGPSGMLMCVIYSCGEIAFGGFAYAIRDWQWLQLGISAPFAIFFFYYWLVPESPRWMLLNGHVNGAKTTLKRIAKSNNKPFSEEILNDFHPEDELGKDEPSNRKNVLRLDLFRTPKLRLITLNMGFNWLMITIAYYGISLTSPSVGGNQYVNFIIISSIEIPAYLFGMVAMDRVGRRYPMCFCMILGGIAGVCTAVVPSSPDYSWIVITLAAVGKFGATCAFGIVYVFTAELYPTVIRNHGIATCSFIGHIGGVVAPYIAALETINVFLPLVIFGACSLATGLVGLTLPETLGRLLPETIEDCEDMKMCACRPEGRSDRG